MKLVRKNLIDLFRFNRIFAYMIVLTQILCTFSVFFAIGVLYNNQYVLLEDQTRTLKINIEFTGNGDGRIPSYKESQECLKEIYGAMEGILHYADFLTTYIDESGHIVSVASSGEWSEGTYLPSNIVNETLAYQMYEGRNLCTDDYTEKRLVALATGNYTDNVVKLYDHEYNVIGYRQEKMLDTDPIIFYIPSTAWNDIPLASIQLNLLRLPSKQEYIHICDILDKWYIEQYTISDYYGGNTDFKALYISLGIALGGIMLVSIWTLLMLYNYVYEKRRWKMTIFSLCGCSRWGNMKICLMEVLCLSLPSCFAGVILFAAVCRLWLNKMYRYIPILFTWRIVVVIFSLIILLFIIENGLLAWIKSGASIKNRMREV